MEYVLLRTNRSCSLFETVLVLKMGSCRSLEIRAVFAAWVIPPPLNSTSLFKTFMNEKHHFHSIHATT